MRLQQRHWQISRHFLREKTSHTTKWVTIQYFPTGRYPELLYLISGPASHRRKTLSVPFRQLDSPTDPSAEQCVSGLWLRRVFSHSQIGSRVAIAVRDVLLSTSRVLESLQATSGVQSFVLAINPNDAEDEGFLGGSPLGREFWRSLRGGGVAGVKALKSLAVSSLKDSSSSNVTLHGTGLPFRPKETAHSLKSEVYARVRTLLRHVYTPCHFTWPITRRHDRSTSGIRNAEMKWTNHGNLSVYGVRLEGWPTNIPMQNPSTLTTGQNRELKDALASGILKFCRINTETSTPLDATATSCGSNGNSSDLSWAIMEEFNTPVRCFLLRRIDSSLTQSVDRILGLTYCGHR
jgi:hypothetical protein